MMENGTSRDVLERMASGENNLVILTGYCMAVLPRFSCDCSGRSRGGCKITTGSFR